jgi:DNA-binding NarL/FixJ family response regulator
MPDRIRILLVDDDAMVRLSLKTIIEADPDLQVVGLASDGLAAIAQYETLRPDVLLMDIRMTPQDGLSAGENILSRHPQARILYLTTFADDAYIIRALRLGARGYMLKQNYESIGPAIKAVHAGQSVFGDDIMERIPLLVGNRQTADLSSFAIRDKEAELIRLVADGLNNREIAARLFLSEGTVRNNLSVILDKLHLRDRTQLAVFYYKQIRSGLAPADPESDS